VSPRIFEHELGRELLALRPLARHLAQDYSDADDLIQNAAVRALIARDRGSYVDTGKLRPWLICILYNQHKRMLRDRRRRPAEPLELVFEDLHPVTMPAGEWAAALADVRNALDRIAGKHSSILLLDALGFSYEEISADQDIKMGTVKSRLNRARERIREEVEGIAA
jgi:RNA polymerase sigma-70 factor (ECF subfamily)